jgi:hypothetical protein
VGTERLPLAIDLFCGLGGWTEGLLAEGYRVVGFDIERHVYGYHAYPAQLVLQDVTTLHGSQFRDAALIVASPPCQEYSYMAMPWTRAKAKAAAYRAHPETQAALTLLFRTCFRLQAEAIAAAGHHIPLVVENVRGAEKWVGKARWHYGSFYLWGDVPALMPMTLKAQKFNPDGTNHGTGSWFAIADSKNRGSSGQKGIPHRPTGHWTNATEHHSDEGRKGTPGKTRNGYPVILPQVVKTGSKSTGRKMASAMIAKIPLALSRHIAATYRKA